MISLQLEMNKQGERQVKLKNSQQLNKDKMEICAKKLKTDKSNSMEKKIDRQTELIYMNPVLLNCIGRDLEDASVPEPLAQFFKNHLIRL